MDELDSYLNSELLATCNSLGTYDKDNYEKDPECLESIKDLIRYLRKDSESHEIRRQLGTIKVLQTDLLQILKFYNEDTELFDVILRLLVNLSNPVVLLYREELPEEKTARKHYLELVAHLQSYKQAFTDSKIWAVLSTKLGKLLQLNSSDREEEDRFTIERILILIRNILHVPADPNREKRTDDDVSIHDQILWALHKSGMEDLLLYLSAAKEEEAQYCFHVLEIISLMFREQNPQHLAFTEGRSQAEKNKDEEELMELKEREKARKKNAMHKISSRYPRFGGNYCIKNVKSISDRDVICHKPISDLHSLSFDQVKMVKRKPKNRQPMQDCVITRRSTLSIRLFLRSFCEEFLSLSYNSLMALVKENLVRQNTQDHDETYYLWGMQFFMEFNRLIKLSLAFVSETISIQTFHYIQTQLDSYYEMIVTDKKKVKHWSKRMHLAVKAYRELLMTLSTMDASEEENIRNCAKVIKGNIFYLAEYRDLLLTLLLNYDEVKFSISYLKDLVETTHIFMKMLETHASKHSHLVIQSKKCRRKKKKTAKPDSQQVGEQLEQEWDVIAMDLSAILQNNDQLPKVSPFDAASDKSIDEQRDEAVIKIKELLHTKKVDEALAMFRAAREVWPDSEMFTVQNIESEEFMALREIFFKSIPDKSSESNIERNEEEEEEEEESQEEEGLTSTVSEGQFNFSDFFKRFASRKVVQSYSQLLLNYQHNSNHINHCIAKMMHRIAWDYKMYGLLFQASVFRIFQKILDDPARHTSTSVGELNKLGVFVIRKFFENAEINKKIFMELLFWKNPREVYEIQEGYGTFEKNRAKILWTEDQEEELRHLFNEYKDVKDADPIDLIMEHISDRNKTRRQVIRQLRVMDLGRTLKVKKAVRAPSTWQEEEVVQLRELFEKYRETTNVLGFILENLTIKRPKHRVIEKLLELKIVTDRKELRKKRTKKATSDKKKQSKRHKKQDGDRSSDEGSSESVEEFEDDTDEDSSPESKRDKFQETEFSDSNFQDADLDRTVPLNTTDLKELLSNMVSEGMQYAIEWLQESLDEAAIDRSENSDAIPFVPILDSHHQAMESQEFKNLLTTVGIMPPSDEQEMFWRIPAKLTKKMLEIRSLVLKKALEGNFTEMDSVVQVEKSLKKQTRVNALQSLVKKNIKNHQLKTNPHNDTSNSVQSEENSTDSSMQKKKQKKLKKIKVISDGIPDSHKRKKKNSIPLKEKINVDAPQQINEKMVPQKMNRKRVKMTLVSDDSEEDMPLLHLSNLTKDNTTNSDLLVSKQQREGDQVFSMSSQMSLDIHKDSEVPQAISQNINKTISEREPTLKTQKKRLRFSQLSEDSEEDDIHLNAIQQATSQHIKENASEKGSISETKGFEEEIKQDLPDHQKSGDDGDFIVKTRKKKRLRLSHLSEDSEDDIPLTAIPQTTSQLIKEIAYNKGSNFETKYLEEEKISHQSSDLQDSDDDISVKTLRKKKRLTSLSETAENEDISLMNLNRTSQESMQQSGLSVTENGIQVTTRVIDSEEEETVSFKRTVRIIDSDED